MTCSVVFSALAPIHSIRAVKNNSSLCFIITLFFYLFSNMATRHNPLQVGAMASRRVGFYRFTLIDWEPIRAIITSSGAEMEAWPFRALVSPSFMPLTL